MNTTKQINAMIGVLFLTILVLGAYLLNESNRQDNAREEQTERIAERGARTFVQNCRTCHGLEGLGPGEGAVGAQLNADAFLILGEGNEYGAEPTALGEAAKIRTFLADTIACGRTGTFMPPWGEAFGGSLSEQRIEQLVVMITEGRWDLVEEQGIEADEEQFGEALREGLGREPTHDELTEKSRAETVVTDPTTLSVTQSNCGQYRGEAAAAIRSRDPFAGAPTGTAEPTATTGATATQPPAGSDGPSVAISLGEYTMTPGQPSVAAGDVTFRVANDGALDHEFIVIRSDAEPDGLPGAGVVDESAVEVLARTDLIAGGGSTNLAVNLTVGRYLLVCNLPGHYSLGMVAAFSVQ